MVYENEKPKLFTSPYTVFLWSTKNIFNLTNNFGNPKPLKMKKTFYIETDEPK
jgi:hypothetical protein